MPGTGGVSLPLQWPLAEIIETFWTVKMLAAQAAALTCLQSWSWTVKKSPIPLHRCSSCTNIRLEGLPEKLQNFSYLHVKISTGTKFHVTSHLGKPARPEMLETVNVTSGDSNLLGLKRYHVPTIITTQQIRAVAAIALGERKEGVGKTHVRTTRVASPSHDRVTACTNWISTQTWEVAQIYEFIPTILWKSHHLWPLKISQLVMIWEYSVLLQQDATTTLKGKKFRARGIF